MYGLNGRDLKQIQNKHEVQRDYLENHNFVTSSGQVKSLLDISFSANHSSRYYTEIINKINTINEIIATELIEYQPIFITVTLDGYFRDFLKSKFSRYDEKKHSNDIPNNERFGFLQNKIKNKEKFTIKDLYNVLNFQLNRFQKSNIFKKIKKNGHNIHYVRVCEPHKKDGVPHLHLMLYVPKIYLEETKNFYIKYFPAPQNIKPLNKNLNDGQLKGFQWDIKSAPAYILKYIFKSFLDVKSQTELDYLQAWYIKNRILRVVTSHSLVPAWVYRKIIPLEQDWHYLTDIKNNFISEWSKENDYIRLEDEYNRVLEYEKGLYKLFYKDRLIKEFGTIKDETTSVEIKPTINLKYKKKIKQPKIIIHSTEYVLKEGVLKEFTPIIPVNKQSLQSLYADYIKMNNVDVENINLHHYGLVKNELIKRKCIPGEIISLNEYNSNFNYGSKL
ncbi:rolling circle replication-associated protein [Aliarcobacter butzleri]|uniref:rolling circle replication-associated protein n=1 Tax=Aliarcobacter butzleri TaxID=28197 RepID=UPI003AF47C25